MDQPDASVQQGTQAAKSGGKLEKATVMDIVLSVVIPAWGILIGGIALIKRESKRGLTMIAISAVMIAIYVALGL